MTGRSGRTDDEIELEIVVLLFLADLSKLQAESSYQCQNPIVQS